ncbi:MAG TPA: hypothetical protein VFT05_05090 [Burkholderiaceae bacterium]|nr:hypothetical protein [Burkholderiaceae bacterium]
MVTSAGVDPNSWGVPELISMGLLAMLYLFGLVFSIWRSFQASWRRLYWMGCLSLMIVGTLVMLFASVDSPTSGEMPRQFGLGVWVVLAGLFGVVAGVISSVFSRFLGVRKPDAPKIPSDRL